MRALTAKEMDIVAGGDGQTVTVTGTRSPQFDWDNQIWPSFFGGGGGGGGGGFGGGGGGGAAAPAQPHAAAGASAAANQFADKIVHNKGTTALDAKVAQEVHDAVAKEFDQLSANPNAVVGIIPGDATHPPTTVYASDVLKSLGEASFNVTDSTSLVGPNGAATSTFSGETNINPQVLEARGNMIGGTGAGDALVSQDGITSLIDHEVAHRFIESFVAQESSSLAGQEANEAFASDLGHQIENWSSLQGLDYSLPGGGGGGYNPGLNT